MKPALCLCSALVRRPTRAHVRVVVHEVELEKSTNSGRLLPLLLQQAQMVSYGGNVPLVEPRSICPPGTRPVVLYPALGAPTIDAFVKPDEPPPCLIVLDGTWHQAARLRKRFLVERIPFARLPDDARPSHYHLRQGHFAQSMSTLEAAARALAILDGDDDVDTGIEAHLVDGFRRMVDRTLWLRGSKDASDVYGGLPAGVMRHDIYSRGYPDADGTNDDDPPTAGG